MYRYNMGGGMNPNYYSNGFHWGPLFWVLGAFAVPVLLLLVLWSIFWKGLALWHSARRGQYWWFVVMLFVNTFGVLEIIYLFGFAKLKWVELFSTHEPHRH